MKPTIQNSKVLASMMSEALTGAVLTVTSGTSPFSQLSRFDKRGLDSSGWSGDSGMQALPVKVSDVQLMWSTGQHSFSVGFNPDSSVEFPAKNVVVVSQFSGSGDFVVWAFIGEAKP